MSLTVEDGTGLAGADSFVSVDDADAYHAGRRTEWHTYSLDEREAALRRASAWLTYHVPWKGLPARGRGQALSWPRTGVTDANDYAVSESEVPAEVITATMELAIREIAEPGMLVPDFTSSERVVMEQIGPLRTEYATGTGSGWDSQPTVPAVQALIAGLVRSESGRISGRVHRI